MNRSTQIKVASRDPSIVAVSRDGSRITGMSPGSTKLVVFGKYTIDVTVVSKHP